MMSHVRFLTVRDMRKLPIMSGDVNDYKMHVHDMGGTSTRGRFHLFLFFFFLRAWTEIIYTKSIP